MNFVYGNKVYFFPAGGTTIGLTYVSKRGGGSPTIPNTFITHLLRVCELMRCPPGHLVERGNSTVDHRTLNRGSPASNPLCWGVSKLGQFRSLNLAPVHSAVYMGPFKCYVTQMGVVQIFRKKALRRCKVQRY